MKNRLRLAVALCWLSASLVSAQTLPPVPIYVFTQPSEFVDEYSKGRSDSLADVLKGLAKKPTLRIVSTPAEAQITLEILRRGYDPIGSTTERTIRMPTIAGGGTSSSRIDNKQYTIEAMLTVGDYRTPIIGHTESIAWRAAASHVVAQVDRWVKANRPKLSSGASWTITEVR